MSEHGSNQEPEAQDPGLASILSGFDLPTDWQAKRLLGRGGFGSVIEVYDQVRRERIAVKLVRIGQGLSPAERQDELVAARKEAALLDIVQLLGSRALPQFYGLHERPAEVMFAMELIPGHSLEEVIERGQPMSEARIMEEIIKPIGGLVAQLHDPPAAIRERLPSGHNRILHGDIKPANIQLTGDPARPAVLLDLGISDTTRYFAHLERSDQFTGVHPDWHEHLSPQRMTQRVLEDRAGSVPYVDILYFRDGVQRTANDVYGLAASILAAALPRGVQMPTIDPYSGDPHKSLAALVNKTNLSFALKGALRQALSANLEDRPADMRAFLREIPRYTCPMYRVHGDGLVEMDSEWLRHFPLAVHPQLHDTTRAIEAMAGLPDAILRSTHPKHQQYREGLSAVVQEHVQELLGALGEAPELQQRELRKLLEECQYHLRFEVEDLATVVTSPRDLPAIKRELLKALADSLKRLGGQNQEPWWKRTYRPTDTEHRAWLEVLPTLTQEIKRGSQLVRSAAFYGNLEQHLNDLASQVRQAEGDRSRIQRHMDAIVTASELLSAASSQLAVQLRSDHEFTSFAFRPLARSYVRALGAYTELRARLPRLLVLNYRLHLPTPENLLAKIHAPLVNQGRRTHAEENLYAALYLRIRPEVAGSLPAFQRYIFPELVKQLAEQVNDYRRFQDTSANSRLRYFSFVPYEDDLIWSLRALARGRLASKWRSSLPPASALRETFASDTRLDPEQRVTILMLLRQLALVQ